MVMNVASFALKVASSTSESAASHRKQSSCPNFIKNSVRTIVSDDQSKNSATVNHKIILDTPSCMLYFPKFRDATEKGDGATL